MTIGEKRAGLFRAKSAIIRGRKAQLFAPNYRDTLTVGEVAADISVNHDQMSAGEIVWGSVGEVGRALDVAGAAGIVLKGATGPAHAARAVGAAQSAANRADDVAGASRALRNADAADDASRAIGTTPKAAGEVPRNPDGTFAKGAGGDSAAAVRGREAHISYRDALGPG